MPVTTTSAATGHDGIPHPRSAPEWSDLALFAVAVVAVGWTRRALRRRHRRDRPAPDGRPAKD